MDFAAHDILLYRYQHSKHSGCIGGPMSSEWCRGQVETFLGNGEGWRVIEDTPTRMTLQRGKAQTFARFETLDA